MSVDTVFKPIGPLTFVGNAAVQVVPDKLGGGVISFRVRNLATAAQYFTWGASSSVTSAGAPSSGTPSPNTIGMLPNTMETFEIPAGSFFIASSATGFEFLAGQGQ